MFKPGDIISYLEMCQLEGTPLQHGMNFRINDGISVFLMSQRTNAPYDDEIKDEGRTLIYEGHNVPRKNGEPDPKSVDQPMKTPRGKLTRNGLFYEAAKKAANGTSPDLVRVYEKLKPAIWVFRGHFQLNDSVIQKSDGRRVFKFYLAIVDLNDDHKQISRSADVEHTRIIPSSVMQNVYKRDGGKCVKCGATNNLHYDHILPFSKGGTSLTEANIQLLCMRHNLRKSNRIE